MALGMDVIAITVMLVLVLAEMLPEKVLRFFYGTILLVIGTLPLLHVFKVIKFDMYAWPLIGFAAMFSVFEVGSILILSGFKEEQATLKILQIIAGAAVVIITMIPWMYEFGAISFDLPKYTEVFNFGVYVTSGVLTVISGFRHSD